jgi:hypothetical protein
VGFNAFGLQAFQFNIDSAALVKYEAAAFVVRAIGLFKVFQNATL